MTRVPPGLRPRGGTPPSEQSSAHYYEDWLSAFESLLLAQGVTQPDEFAVRVKEYEDLRRDPIF
jgi:hypothetical protein